MSHDDHHGHSHKYYENEEGLVYHPTELAAYRLHTRNLGKCVNVFVPMKECFRGLSKFQIAFDEKKGNCHKEKDAYEHCMDRYRSYQNAIQAQNMFYNATSKAKEEGASNTLSNIYYRLI